MSCPTHFYQVFCKGACFNHSLAILSCVFVLFLAFVFRRHKPTPSPLVHMLMNQPMPHDLLIAPHSNIVSSQRTINFVRKLYRFWRKFASPSTARRSACTICLIAGLQVVVDFLFVVGFVCHCLFVFAFCFFLIRFHKPCYLVKKQPSKAMTRLRSVLEDARNKSGKSDGSAAVADTQTEQVAMINPSKTKQGPSGNFATNKQHPQTTDIVTSTNHAHNT